MADRPIRDLYHQARKDERLFTLPNICSFIRILLVPVIVYYLLDTTAGGTYRALILMLIAYGLDIFDGWYARTRNQTTRLGAMLDPLADKLLTNAVIITMILFRKFPIWFAGVVIFRDITYIIFVFTLLKGKDVVLDANRWGKVTAFFVTVTVFAYVAFGSWQAASTCLLVLQGICLSLIIGSAINYLNRYIGHIHDGDNGTTDGGTA